MMAMRLAAFGLGSARTWFGMYNLFYFLDFER